MILVVPAGTVGREVSTRFTEMGPQKFPADGELLRGLLWPFGVGQDRTYDSTYDAESDDRERPIMQTRHRSRRAEVADLCAQMRAANATVAQVADRIRERAAHADLSAALGRIDLRATPDEVGPDTLRDVSIISAGYRRAYRSTPAAQLFDAANAHLSLVITLRPQAQTEPVRRALLTVLGEMAALSAVLLLLDMNRPREGWRHLDLAWAAARAAESRELQAIVLAGRSFGVSYHHHDHKNGLDLAEGCSQPDQGRYLPRHEGMDRGCRVRALRFPS